MVRYPCLVGGSERFDTALIAAGGGRWFCKGGALGFWAAGVFPSAHGGRALGIALKIEDGGHPPSCQAAVEVFAQLRLLDDRQLARLASWHHIPTNNALGETIGLSRPEFELIRRK
jgi:L-asparaginase II